MYEMTMKFWQKCLLWMLVAILSLPLSFAFMGLKPAHAAAKEKAAQSAPKIVKKMNFIGEPTGLHRGNTYVTGQSIHIRVMVSGEPVSVWAEIGALDPNFDEIAYFKDLGAGEWDLGTSRLSQDLVLGSHLVKIVAENRESQKVQTQIKVVLQEFGPAKILSYKVRSDQTVAIDWQSQSYADAYLISWQIQNDDASSQSMQIKPHQTTIANLVNGTFYEVAIQPLRGDAVGEALKVVFKTLGIPPLEQVESIPPKAIEPATTKEITPLITPKAASTQRTVQSTSTPEAQTTPQSSPSPSPSVSPSPSAIPSGETEAQTGGWNKLLIALSILIIAAGAAIGGYYGYEWLMIRGKDKEPPKSSSNTGSRW